MIKKTISITVMINFWISLYTTPSTSTDMATFRTAIKHYKNSIYVSIVIMIIIIIEIITTILRYRFFYYHTAPVNSNVTLCNLKKFELVDWHASVFTGPSTLLMLSSAYSYMGSVSSASVCLCVCLCACLCKCVCVSACACVCAHTYCI